MPIKSSLKVSPRGFFEEAGENRGGYNYARPPPVSKVIKTMALLVLKIFLNNKIIILFHRKKERETMINLTKSIKNIFEIKIIIKYY